MSTNAPQRRTRSMIGSVQVSPRLAPLFRRSLHAPRYSKMMSSTRASLGQNPFVSKPDIQVLDVQGVSVSLKELTTGPKTAKALLHEKPKMDAAGVRLIALSVGVPEKGKAFCEKVPFPEDALYLDPERVAYKELSLYEGWGRTFFALATPKALAKMEFSKFRESVKGYDFSFTKPPRNSDALQQGGLFVFDGAEVLYAHKDEGTADHAPMEDVLAACCGVQA